MIRLLLIYLLFSFFLSLSVFSKIPENYYKAATDLSGNDLKEALYNIIKGQIEYSYTSTSTDVWDILKESDQDADSSENVVLVYTQYSVSGSQEYNSGTGWSREHVWAKSHGDFGTDKGAGTDLHNLKPADISVNSARNNKDFDDGGEQYFDNGGTIATSCYNTSYSWEPTDKVKGDIARIIFYMATRYNGENNEPSLSIVDAINTIDLCDNDNKIGYMGRLSSLLRWNNEDPIDSFEIKRNELIYKHQNNRNPFIDHPEYINKIWQSVVTNINSPILKNTLITTHKNSISVTLAENENTRMSLYNITGVIISSQNITGSTTYNNLTSGIYILTLQQGNDVLTKKILIH